MPAAASKSELATEFKISVKTLMRWLKSFNQRQAEPLDLTGKLFSPSDARRIREHFA